MVDVIEIKMPKIPRGLLGRAPAGIINREARLAIDRGVTIMRRSVRAASPVRIGTLRSRWQKDKARTTAGNTEGSTFNNLRKGRWSIAFVLEEGTKNHPFPPVTRGSEPALAPWMRSKNDFFVDERGPGGQTVRRPANLALSRDMFKVAFKIGKKIKQRGLPANKAQRGRFSRAIKRIRPDVTREFGKMLDRIAKRLVD